MNSMVKGVTQWRRFCETLWFFSANIVIHHISEKDMMNKSDRDRALKESVDFCPNQMRANTHVLLMYREWPNRVRFLHKVARRSQISISTKCVIQWHTTMNCAAQCGVAGGNVPFEEEQNILSHFFAPFHVSCTRSHELSTHLDVTWDWNYKTGWNFVRILTKQCSPGGCLRDSATCITYRQLVGELFRHVYARVEGGNKNLNSFFCC